MYRTRLCDLMLLALLGCEGPDEDSAEANENAVVNGKASTSEQDAVVKLFNEQASETCTGTLIAPNAILTARHCLAVRDQTGGRLGCEFAKPNGEVYATEPDFPYAGNVSPGKLRVSTDRADGGNPSWRAKGVEVFAPAGPEMCGADIAIVIIDAPIRDIAPREIRMTAPAVGELLTAVGWGKMQDGKFPEQRMQRTDIPVLALGATYSEYVRRNGTEIPLGLSEGEFAVGESVCNGDSGGPTLDSAGAVVGVVSRVANRVSQRCVDQPAIYTQPGAHAALVQAAIQRAGELAP